VETLTYSSGRASGCDSPGLLNVCRSLSHRRQPPPSAIVVTWRLFLRCTAIAATVKPAA
jgi:hypothetical protein